MSAPNTGFDGSTTHYGSADDPYEVIKIIDHYRLNFTEGSILKYLLRYKKKDGLKDLKKALFYLNRLVHQETEKDQLVTVTPPATLSYSNGSGDIYYVRPFVLKLLTSKDGGDLEEKMEKIIGMSFTESEARAIISQWKVDPSTLYYRKIMERVRG